MDDFELMSNHNSGDNGYILNLPDGNFCRLTTSVAESKSRNHVSVSVQFFNPTNRAESSVEIRSVFRIEYDALSIRFLPERSFKRMGEDSPTGLELAIGKYFSIITLINHIKKDYGVTDPMRREENDCIRETRFGVEIKIDSGQNIPLYIFGLDYEAGILKLTSEYWPAISDRYRLVCLALEILNHDLFRKEIISESRTLISSN